MNAMDTNVLLRLLLRDDPAQVERVLDLVTGNAGMRINETTIAETAWVLSRQTSMPRREVEERLVNMLAGRSLVPLDGDVLARARFESAAHGFGLADGLIGARNAKVGCATTYTFDKRAARSDLFTMVP